MRFSLHLAVGMLVAASSLTQISVTSAADADSRAAVTGRQTIRAELADAMVDGHITRDDRRRLLDDAQRLLSPTDYRSFSSALDRLVTATDDSRMVHSNGTHRLVNAEVVATPKSSPSTSSPTTPSSMKSGATKSGSSPFIEESSPGSTSRPALDLPVDDHESLNVERMKIDTESSDESAACFDDSNVGFRDGLNFDVITGIDGFKGPLDFDNANGNFGSHLGINAATPLLTRLGLGAQLGIDGVVSDLKGIPFSLPNSQMRSQMFLTVGLFDRINVGQGRMGIGAVYDWSFDEYYSYFDMGQWRGKMNYEFSPCNEVGLTAMIAEHGAHGALTAFGTLDLFFKPMDQGYVYWKHTFDTQATLAGRFGVAERPGQFVYGATGTAPISDRASLYSDFSYIMPQVGGGAVGQTQEVWNISIGMEFKFGGHHEVGGGRFDPFLPVADNGSFATRLLQ